MIRAQNLSKRYMIYDHPLDRLHDWIVPESWRRGKPFWALQDINLEVKPGTSLGVVGVNGAGKSTLLKLLTGTTVPTSGTFSIDGRVSALLELGMGFHPQFTGRENISFNGKMLGLTDDELRVKTPQIIDFAEITDFIDQPLRTYSSGMALRLAFAVASSVEPDVLIVDEALAVGDLHFQQKCLARIRQFRERGVTVLFVSHDPGLIKTFCNEAILLDAGRLIDHGKPDHVLDYYNALLAEKYRDRGSQAQIVRPKQEAGSTTTKAQENRENANGQDTTAAESTESPVVEGHRVGNFRAMITRVSIESQGTAGNSRLFTPGSQATITVRGVAFERIQNPTFGVMIKDRLGSEIYGINTELREIDFGAIEAGQALEVQFSALMNLGPGLYSITAAIHQGATHTDVCYDWIERAETFQVLPTPSDPFVGVCRLDMVIRHQRGEASEKELSLASKL